MRRRLLVIALGISFLIGMTWLGTVVTSIVPRHPTAQVQTLYAGPYELTVRVNPNPPLITQPTALTLNIVRPSGSGVQQTVTNAHVTVEGSMETMDMGTGRAPALVQAGGMYLGHIQFSMSGLWQVRVLVDAPGTKTESALFEVMVQ